MDYIGTGKVNHTIIIVKGVNYGSRKMADTIPGESVVVLILNTLFIPIF